MKIKALEVTEDNFKIYGSVLTGTKGSPTSQAPDYRFWSNIINYNIEGETEIGICTVYKQKENILNGMERHLNTPEILIPIDAPFVLPLLQNQRAPEKTEAFKVKIGQAVKINNSVWHGACLPVDTDEASYFVIFKKGTPFNDIEKISFDTVMVET